METLLCPICLPTRQDGFQNCDIRPIDDNNIYHYYTKTFTQQNDPKTSTVFG